MCVCVYVCVCVCVRVYICVHMFVCSRPQYYKLIEECVTQIVLHRNGLDPDFRHTKKFEIDVEPLLSKLLQLDQY